MPRLVTVSKAGKHPIPTDDVQEKVRERLRATFKTDDPKLTPSAAVALAAKMRTVIRDEKPGSPNHYVLLLEIMQLSMKAGNLDGVVESAQRISAVYEAPDLVEMLTVSVAQTLGAKEKTDEFKKVVTSELERPTTPDALIALGKDWLVVRKHCQVDARHLVARHARQLLLEGLASPQVKGLERAEAEQSLQEAEAEIELADAKAGRFTLYAGKWVVKYDNKYTHEYVITLDGALAFDRAISPDGKPFVKKEEQKAKLVRQKGAVVVSFAGGKAVERFEMRGDALVIERVDYVLPKHPIFKGEGTRVPPK